MDPDEMEAPLEAKSHSVPDYLLSFLLTGMQRELKHGVAMWDKEGKFDSPPVPIPWIES
jgi:hypothetical protein